MTRTELRAEYDATLQNWKDAEDAYNEGQTQQQLKDMEAAEAAHKEAVKNLAAWKPSNKVGEILTAWDGTEYDSYGVKHIIISKSEPRKDGVQQGMRYVSTVAVKKNGKAGQRGMDFYVSDKGSIEPVNAYHYFMGDTSYRPTFYRVKKSYFEHIIQGKLGL